MLPQLALAFGGALFCDAALMFVFALEALGTAAFLADACILLLASDTVMVVVATIPVITTAILAPCLPFALVLHALCLSAHGRVVLPRSVAPRLVAIPVSLIGTVVRLRPLLPRFAFTLFATVALLVFSLPIGALGLFTQGGLPLAFTAVLFALPVVRPLFLALAFAQGLLALPGSTFVALCLGALALFPDRGLALLLAIGQLALSFLRLARIVGGLLRLPRSAFFLAATLFACAILRLRAVGPMLARTFLCEGGQRGRGDDGDGQPHQHGLADG